MRKMARGEGNLGCIFWGLLVLIVGVVALRAVPVQVAKMKLEDQMKEMALTQPRKSARFFERQIYAMAGDLDLPVDKRDISVKKSEKRVVMDVEMVVPLDLMIFEYDWRIKIHVDRDIFLF